MRKLGILLGILALTLAAAGARSEVVRTRSIEVEAPVIDLGSVHRGERLQAIFHVKNGGTETLAISDARPSCGCTVATFDREIGPGSTGTVRATVDTSKFTGPISKKVVVVSNDPERPRIDLTIKAIVQP